MNIPVDKRLGMLKTSAVAAACLTLMSFLVACGGGAGSANSSSWEKAITPPKLTGISPASGPTTGGTTVTTAGTDIQKGASVLFGDVPAAKINSVTSTSIEAVTPVHDPGKVDVKVTNPDTRSDTLLGAFTFEGSPPPIVGPAPTISSALPNSGPVVGGTVVTITGTDFQSGATVTFGESPATPPVVFSSATQLQATTPAHFPGTVNVIVRNPDTQSATVPGGFTYQPVPAPTTISILPTSGPEAGGTLVTVWGTNFLEGATVSFGGVAAASVTVTSATQLGAVTPPHATGVVDVRVTNLDDQFATLVAGFTYGTPPPTITSVSPNSGTIAGGTLVTMTGTGFQPGVPGTTVTFGAVAGTGVNVLSYTKIQVTTPAHAAGAVDVKDTNPDSQSATLPGGYTYVTSPIIASLSVDSGLDIGGTPVTIRGSNFAGDAAVTFGAVDAASVNVVSSTQIVVTTPSQAAGTIVDVTVTNPDTLQGTLPSAFRYGSILFSDGFELGDFSKWDLYFQHNSVNPVNSVIASTPGVNVWTGTKAYQMRFVHCGIDVPAATTLGQTAGGSNPLTTYYVRYTYYTTDDYRGMGAAGETKPSAEQSLTVSANHYLTVTSPPAATGLTGLNVYISDSAGNEKKQNVTPIGIGTDWTQSAALSTGTAAPPSTNTACRAESDHAVIWRPRNHPAWPNGIHHFFMRGWMKFAPQSPPMTVAEYPHMIRKIFYLFGAYHPATNSNGYSVVLSTMASHSYTLLRMFISKASSDGQCGTITTETAGEVPYEMGKWYDLEVEVLQNSVPGSTDGLIRVWMTPEGEATSLIIEKTGINVSGNCTDGFGQMSVGYQVNASAVTEIVDEYRYWDDIVVGDAYIGPQVPPP